MHFGLSVSWLSSLFTRATLVPMEPSLYQLRFNRPYDLSKLHAFGCACYYLSEEHDNFASRERLGVALGYIAGCSRTMSWISSTTSKQRAKHGLYIHVMCASVALAIS